MVSDSLIVLLSRNLHLDILHKTEVIHMIAYLPTCMLIKSIGTCILIHTSTPVNLNNVYAYLHSCILVRVSYSLFGVGGGNAA